MSSEEGKAYISGKLLMSKDERPDYLFPRLHQADCVSWLKALIVQGSQSYMSLILDFDNNSLLPPLRCPLLLVPGSRSIPCGSSTFYLYLVNVPFSKPSLNFPTLSVPSVSLLRF